MIEIAGIHYAYGPNAPALSNISFRVESGEKLVLLGANGSGKSTLLKLLNGLMLPQQGSFRYRDQLITEKALKDKAFAQRFRREVVYLFQHPATMLFNPTVFDEIAFGLRQLRLDAIDERVRHWAGILDIEHLLDRPPFKLSGGEQQKVCLAALLALEPSLLLLDEPTANLDPRTTGWLVDFLQDLKLTTLVATHNLSLAPELGNRGLVLGERDGLLYDGPIEDLLQNREALIAGNLVHTHRHRHGAMEHRHFHIHDWD